MEESNFLFLPWGKSPKQYFGNFQFYNQCSMLKEEIVEDFLANFHVSICLSDGELPSLREGFNLSFRF
jgi:hypothetical protein